MAWQKKNLGMEFLGQERRRESARQSPREPRRSSFTSRRHWFVAPRNPAPPLPWPAVNNPAALFGASTPAAERRLPHLARPGRVLLGAGASCLPLPSSPSPEKPGNFGRLPSGGTRVGKGVRQLPQVVWGGTLKRALLVEW